MNFFVRKKCVSGSWKLWFSYMNIKKWKISSFWLIFDSELKGKRSQAEPSWKSFSSSSCLSQLGSDSSLPSMQSLLWQARADNFILLFFSCLVIVDWMDISAVQFLIASQMNYWQTFLHYMCHLKEDLPGASEAVRDGGVMPPPPLRFGQMCWP